MKTIYSVIEKLRNTPARNEKIQIMEDIKNSSDKEFENLFKKVVQATYDTTLNYNIKEFDPYFSDNDFVEMSLDDALDHLYDRLIIDKLRGDEARLFVSELYQGVKEYSDEEAETFKLVIERDLDCGAKAKTINKVWPKLIYIHPYMRCSSFNLKNLKNIEFPCYSQVKKDGLYVDVVIENNSVTYRARSGEVLKLNDEERDNDLLFVFKDKVIQGEVLIKDGDSYMPREKGNGFLNSDDFDPNQAHLFLWDVVDLKAWNGEKVKSKPSYKERYGELLRSSYSLEEEWFNVLDVTVCENEQDIIDHFKEMLEDGEEGTVVKNYKTLWKDGTSKDIIKIKVVFDVDLKVTGWKYGKGQFKDKLGTLTCQTSDGVLEVGVGGGFTHEQREVFLDKVEEWIDNEQIVTIRANDITTVENDNGELKKSLFLPRFVDVRNDKDEADSFERVVEQKNAVENIVLKIRES